LNRLVIISLKYLEPYYENTLKCLQEIPYPILFADRDGVGNMSRAFNEAFNLLPFIDASSKCGSDKIILSKYVWFITNVTFTPDVPEKLMQVLDSDPNIAAVHPAMATSDHRHLWPGETRDVPFIEFTAPMFRAADFARFMLDENTPYYYMDLIISHQLKQEGKRLVCVGDAEVQHTYLRNERKQHPITNIRKQLRDYHTPISKRYMEQTFGADWQTKLWPK